MQQKIKRKIAKEILILFTAIFLIGLVWLLIWTFNNFNNRKYESLQAEINELTLNIDSIQNSQQDPLFDFYKKLKENPTIDGLPENYVIFRKALSEKQIAVRFYSEISKNSTVEGPPKNFNSFSLLLTKNNAWKSYQGKLNIINKLNSELKIIASRISSQPDIFKLFQSICVIILIVFYPLRFLLLLFLWALKTVRLKD